MKLFCFCDHSDTARILGRIGVMEKRMADLFAEVEARFAAAIAGVQAKIDELKAQINAGGMTAEEEAAAQAKLADLAAQLEAVG